MQITGENLERLFRGFKTNFQSGFSGVKPMWDEVAMKVSSSTSSEDYGWLGEFPNMREWIGARVIKSISTHDYTIKNKKFELTVGVNEDKIDDDQYGIYAPMMTELGRSAAVHPDQLVYGLLKDGFEVNCYDGQPYFDTDHPVLDPETDEATSVSNVQDGTGAPWFLMDTSRAVKPIIYQERKAPRFVSKTDPKTSDRTFEHGEHVYGVDYRGNVGFGFWQLAFASKQPLTKDKFRAARTAMMKLKSDEGRPLGVMPTKLIVGTSNADAARDLLLPERLSNGATNTDRNLVSIVEVPWLD